MAEEHWDSLLALFQELESAMGANLAFKRNAGKNIGSYNLAKCRYVTDKANKVWLEAAALSDLQEVIELGHSMIVRTSF